MAFSLDSHYFIVVFLLLFLGLNRESFLTVWIHHDDIDLLTSELHQNPCNSHYPPYNTVKNVSRALQFVYCLCSKEHDTQVPNTDCSSVYLLDI